MQQDAEITAYYRQWSPAVYGTCFRILNNREDAEECMQDAFVKLFTGKNKFLSEAARFAWLKKVAVSTSIDRLRWKASRDADWIEDKSISKKANSIENEDCADEYNYGVTGDNNKVINAIKIAVYQLPDGYRAVLSLHLFEGYDFEEIAEIMRLKNVSVRTQYSRARMKLQEILKQQGYGLA